jgi:hypothetical protein
MIHRITPLVLAVLFACVLTHAQDDRSKHRIKLFLDCSNMWCDQTFIRTEINIVDFVFDRIAADVHVLVTTQALGNGGEKYQLIFYGQQSLNTRSDTLHFSMLPLATEVEIREKLLTYLKIGLVPFISRTDMAQYIKLEMKRDDSDIDRVADERDRWNYWVFRLGANGSIHADQNYLSTNLNANFSANRTTEETRVEFRFSTGKNETVFTYDNDEGVEEKYTVNNTNYNFRHVFVKSMTDHWSYGYYLFQRNNTFSNYQNSLRFTPAIEYNIFPYKDVNNKYLAFGYGIDLTHNNYYEETLYGKMNENLFGHTVRLVSSFNQKWGTLRGSVYYNNFFHDWSLYSIELNLEVDVRITGNLSFFAYMFGGLTRNQVFIPKAGASEKDVLARRRQLASGYNFGTWFGISYRFGSMLNNFVNPRFSENF